MADSEESPADEWIPPALPGAPAVSASERQQRLWTEQPDALHAVVVMLTVGSEGLEPESLGMTSYAAIPYQPGMFTVTMCGSDLLGLAARPEVEQIVPDDEVGAL